MTDEAIKPDLCCNCGEPLTEERPDRHEHGLRRCTDLTSRYGDVYASRGYPRTISETQRTRARIIAEHDGADPKVTTTTE